MTWNYRVMHRDGELAIYEVFYDAKGNIEGWTKNPSFPAAESAEALKADCARYLDALSKPILEYKED